MTETELKHADVLSSSKEIRAALEGVPGSNIEEKLANLKQAAATTAAHAAPQGFTPPPPGVPIALTAHLASQGRPSVLKPKEVSLDPKRHDPESGLVDVSAADPVMDNYHFTDPDAEMPPMSAALGDLTPSWYRAYAAKHGKEALRARYKDRVGTLPVELLQLMA